MWDRGLILVTKMSYSVFKYDVKFDEKQLCFKNKNIF